MALAFSYTFDTVPAAVLLGALVALGGLVGGCDQVSRLDDPAPPRVADLRVMPDSVQASALPPDQVQDSVAQFPLRVSARAADPDGRIERVVFTVEPASMPQSAAFGQLKRQEGDRYGRALALSVPATRDEVYSVRVFAVDTDSLSSNQVIGQFRFLAPE